MSARPTDRSSLAAAAGVAAVFCALWAAAVAITGGFQLHIWSVTISSRAWERPAIAALLLTVGAALWLRPEHRRAALQRLSRGRTRLMAGVERGAERLRPAPALVAAVIASTTFVVGWMYGTQTASGADGFAYVSQAALWRTGRLDVPVPLAARAPWPEPAATFAPFGYRASTDGRSIVPITAPGLPMVMALAQAIGGHRAAFVVTPLAGALVIWITFLIGRETRSAWTGVAAAWLVATSPAFLFMLMWPMTDVPAALMAALTVWLAARTSRRSAALAGLAAAVGFLTRPNFLLVTGAVALWLAARVLFSPTRRADLHRLLVFAGGVAPAVGVTVWLNMRWFGRALASGYGTTGELLSWARVLTNGERYATWLAESSPLLYVGLAALVVPIARIWGARPFDRASLFGLVTGATVSVYLVYQSFTDWWYLRFLLPAWPVMAVAAAAGIFGLASRSRPLRAAAVVVVVVSGVAGFNLSRARGVFGLGEERYASVARLVATTTEPQAVIITSAHSGTVRYYAGRETIRYEVLDPAWLDRAIEWLAARGRKPYVLVEDWERPLFRERFGRTSTLGQLEFVPAATWESVKVAGRVYLYDPIDRERFATADPGPLLERDMPRSLSSAFPRLAYEQERAP